MTAMHVVLDARYLDGGYSGIGTYSRLLIEGLAELDTETRYSVIVRPGFHGRLTVGRNFDLLSYRAKPVSMATYFRMHEYIADLEPDIVHALSPQAPVFLDVPTMVTVHDLQPFMDPDFSAKRPRTVRAAYNFFYRWAYPTTLAKAKWVACDSYATRDDVARMFPRAAPKLVVAHPGVDPGWSGPATEAQVEGVRAKFDLRGPYFLYYGSTRPNKNLPNLVEGFARYLRDGNGDSGSGGDKATLVLVLSRDRFYKDVKRAVERGKLQEHVKVLDPVEPAEQRALVTGCRAFAFPSKFEGFGFPPLEAMACDVPVLAGDSGSLPEVVGDAALLVDPDNPQSIANGLAVLAEDERLREVLVERGRRRVALFDWKETAARIRDIYELLF